MNGEKRLLVGTVLSIQNRSFTYPACPNCFSRLIHTRSRYECHRCGSACKAATHRYKLCVKVAEDRKLHIITVFGRCLEKVFGASADSLHRLLFGPDQLPGDLESDRSRDLLFQAAEHCLVGRSFIFSVKIPGDLGRNNSLSLSDSHRSIVACQIILPNDEPIGCTILNRFRRLVESELSNSLTKSRADISTDTTPRDSSFLGISDLSYSLHQSWNQFGDYWQQSLGLSPSPLVSTSSVSACCDCRQCRCNRPECLSHQEDKLFVQRKINPSDVKDILTTNPRSILSTSTPRAQYSSVNVPKTQNNNMCYCSPQTSPHSHSPCFKSKMDSGQESYLQNTGNSGSCRSQSDSACAEQSLSRNVKPAVTHQGEDKTWEEFPFSESLSKIIAEIEDSEGARSDLTVTENELHLEGVTEGSHEKHCREQPDFITTPDALFLLSKSGRGTVLENTTRYSLDRGSGDESNTLVLNHSCEISNTDDTGSPSEQTISLSGNLQGSLEKNRVLDFISRDSVASLLATQNPSVALQHAACSPRNETVVYNCTGDKENLETSNVSCRFINNINKFVISLGKGSFSDLKEKVGVENGIKSTLSSSDEMCIEQDKEVFNASYDLFDTSNNMEGTLAVIPQSKYTGSLKKRGQGVNKHCLKNTLSDSPCTEVFPYCRRNSLSNAKYLLENYEFADTMDTQDCDFLPYLQSTPVLRRLSAASWFGSDRQLFNPTSNAKSSIFSVRRKSNSSVTNFLLRKIRPSLSQHKSTLFRAIANNFPLLCSPVSSSFSNSEGSKSRTPLQRNAKFVCKSISRKRILDNIENCGVQGCNNGSNKDMGCAVRKSDCTNVRDEMDKCDTNHLYDVVNMSPVICSLQQSECHYSTRDQLPGGWSPELFSEKSNICQRSDDLQRRLF
ncbi:DNA damage-induced apoptosis suppressor protein [Mixophyes fleayi]|uniref:DNA damage-induced apoptosis suppressor protein n=1 Tax=Mixophyes fleayi TaxID=3061075 RepID=UPI003F4E0E45